MVGSPSLRVPGPFLLYVPKMWGNVSKFVPKMWENVPKFMPKMWENVSRFVPKMWKCLDLYLKMSNIWVRRYYNEKEFRKRATDVEKKSS